MRKVHGEHSEAEGEVKARRRKTDMMPSKEEVEERNIDHAVFRSWCTTGSYARAFCTDMSR